MYLKVGTIVPPDKCKCYYTYTSRITCRTAEEINGVRSVLTTLVYKDFKTLLCRLFPYRFRIVFESERIVQEYENVPSCELVLGKRGDGEFSGWASFVQFRLTPDGEVELWFDRFRYNLFKGSVESPPSEEEVLEWLKETAKKLQEHYDRCD